MFQIREANLQDAKAIQRLNALELGYEYPLEKTIEALQKVLCSDFDKILVASKNKQVIGYIHANHYQTTYFAPMKNIMGIAVDHRYQRLGVGSQLLQAIESWAIKDKVAGVRLVSGKNRKQAHAFYNTLGYYGGKEQMNFKKIVGKAYDKDSTD